MMLSGRAGLLALLLAGAPGILGAEDLPAAVGRISYGEAPVPGAAICSGALVAPGLVLTAAHCVQGAAADPGSIRFDADWSGGRPAARRRGAAVILPGGAPAEGMAGLAGDVALVVLEAPFPPGTVAHLPLADPAGETFTLIAFDRTAPKRPPRRDSCGALATAPGLLGLGCAVVSGNSGAPLLEADEKGGWHIVAVMVAASRAGHVRSWAALPPDGLRARILSAGE
jgi:protease YdgD